VLPQGYSASDVPVTLTFDPSYNISGNASIFDEIIFPVADSNSTFGEVCSGTVTCTLGPLDLSLTYNVPLTSLTNILINAQVQVDSPNGAIASIDPGIGLILPTGVTFTSESGEFLTQTATPLPATLPLFATGLGTLGLLGWRRKRKSRAGVA
jgi:hypothetical protein